MSARKNDRGLAVRAMSLLSQAAAGPDGSARGIAIPWVALNCEGGIGIDDPRVKWLRRRGLVVVRKPGSAPKRFFKGRNVHGGRSVISRDYLIPTEKGKEALKS